MNKTNLFIIILLSFNSFSINIINKDKYIKQFEELNEIKKSQIISSYLGEFKNLTNDFSYNYENNNSNNNNKKHIYNNTIKFGPFLYNITNQNNNNNNSNSPEHKIAISKKINEFFYNKWELERSQALLDYNKSSDIVKKEYFDAIDTYSSLLIKKSEYESSKILVEKLKYDMKILEQKHKLGLLSDIEYENYSLQISIKNSEISLLEDELNNIVDLLKEKDILVDLDNLEEFEIKDIKIVNNEKEKIELEKRVSELKYNKALSEMILPTISVNANYNITKKSYGVGLNITKTFDITGKDIKELEYNRKNNQKLYENKLKNIDNKYKQDIAQYKLLINKYKIAISKEEIAKKELEVANIKHKVGNIKYDELLSKTIDYHNAKTNTVKAKCELGAFILKKEI